MKSESVGNGILETWTPQDVAAACARGEVVVIDVRTPQEYMFEHVEGAMLLPMPFFRADMLPGQSDKRIILHCGSGGRSAMMARVALEHGIERIAHMDGGFAAWKLAGLPYIGTNMGTGAPERMKAAA